MMTLFAAVLMLGLSACGVASSYDMEEGWNTREVVVHMLDGREVPCIRVYDGISCDWDNATVATPRVPVKSVPTPAPTN
jgi:hypothetical protein